jgi:hypothetical protein
MFHRAASQIPTDVSEQLTVSIIRAMQHPRRQPSSPKLVTIYGLPDIDLNQGPPE